VILLDTSVLSRVFRRQRPGPQERQLQATFEALMVSDVPLGLPGIVLQEVLSGLPSEKQFRDLRAKLLGAFTIVPASVVDHVEAARLKNLCAGKGVNVSGIDCLIAACTIAGGHELFAADADFVAISKHSTLRLFKATEQPGP
jgi:predicted nucleic acid-binding protein